MSLNDQLKKAIKQLAGTDLLDTVRVIACTVKSVNEDDFECDVTAIGGDATTEIPSVQLAAESNDGLLFIPKVDSTVIVTITDRGLAYISLFSDIEKIVFLDGTYGGIIKITDLTNEINNRYTILKAAMLAGFTATDASISALGGTPGAVTAYNAAIASFTNLNKSAYENTKIKHGT